MTKLSNWRVSIGRAVRNQRLSYRLSQRRVALEAGISRSCLAAIESGASNFTIDVLKAVSEVLDLEPQELF